MMIGANSVLILSAKAGGWENRIVNLLGWILLGGSRICPFSYPIHCININIKSKSYSSTLLLRRAILLLNILLKLLVSPVEKDLSTFCSNQKALHLNINGLSVSSHPFMQSWHRLFLLLFPVYITLSLFHIHEWSVYLWWSWSSSSFWQQHSWKHFKVISYYIHLSACDECKHGESVNISVNIKKIP